MHWESWSAFWAMGGRAPFVWGSYGVALALMLLELWLLRRQWRQTLAAVVEANQESWASDAGKFTGKEGQ